ERPAARTFDQIDVDDPQRRDREGDLDAPDAWRDEIAQLREPYSNAARPSDGRRAHGSRWTSVRRDQATSGAYDLSEPNTYRMNDPPGSRSEGRSFVGYAVKWSSPLRPVRLVA